MATFVIVHGAWSGGWSWRKMRPLLGARGHEVHTPTCTGLGERAHLANRETGLGTHIEDVCAVLEYEDLHEVVLLGHSYGGMVVTGVADRAADRIRRVVYLDAFVPENERSLFDYQSGEARTGMREAARAHGEGWRIPPNPPPADTSEADLAWVLPRRNPLPIKAFEDPIRLTGRGAEIPRTYIYCTRPRPGDVFGQFARRAKSEPGWEYLEIDASHSPHITTPDTLAEMLDGIVARGA